MVAKKKPKKKPEKVIEIEFPALVLDVQDLEILHDLVEYKAWELANWLFQEKGNLSMRDRAKKLGVPFDVACLVDGRRDRLFTISSQLENMLLSRHPFPLKLSIITEEE